MVINRKEDLCVGHKEEVANMAKGKIKGVDGKACWPGYRYAGTKNGKDICVPIKK